MNNMNVHKNAYSVSIQVRIGRSDLIPSKFCQFLIDLIAQIQIHSCLLRQKALFFDCHSGLDKACPMLDTGESSICELDSRWSLSRTCRLDPTTGYGARMMASELM